MVGGDGKFFLEMGGVRNGEGKGFIMVDGKFLYIAKGANPLFYEDPTPKFPFTSPPLFKFCLTPSPTSVSLPTPTHIVLSVVLFLWLSG